MPRRPKTGEKGRKREETKAIETKEARIDRYQPKHTTHQLARLGIDRRGRNACMHEGRSPQCSCSGSLALWLGSGSGSRSHLFFFRSVFPTCAHEVARHVLRVCNAARSASRRARGKGGYLGFPYPIYIYIPTYNLSPTYTIHSLGTVTCLTIGSLLFSSKISIALGAMAGPVCPSSLVNLTLPLTILISAALRAYLYHHSVSVLAKVRTTTQMPLSDSL